MVDQKQDILSILESQFSSWLKMKRALALVMLFKSKLLLKIDVQMMEDTKKLIIRMVQRRSFETEIETMRSNGKSQ